MDTTIPTRLADRAYLAAYHLDKQRLTGDNRAQVLSAAMLIELWLAGALSDESKTAVARASTRTGHPVSGREAELLSLVRDSGRPRRWKSWVRRDAATTERAVRARLAQQRVIRVEERRLLGLFDRPKVTVRDTRVVRELVARCRRAVLDPTPVQQVDPLDAALVAIVADAEWDTVFSSKERRAHRARIAELRARSGPAAKALRDVIRQDQAAAAAGG